MAYVACCLSIAYRLYASGLLAFSMAALEIDIEQACSNCNNSTVLLLFLYQTFLQSYTCVCRRPLTNNEIPISENATQYAAYINSSPLCLFFACTCSLYIDFHKPTISYNIFHQLRVSPPPHHCSYSSLVFKQMTPPGVKNR